MYYCITKVYLRSVDLPPQILCRTFLHTSKSHSVAPCMHAYKSMDDNCGEWVECMGVASGYGEQEVGAASASGWNLWVWL